MQNIERSVLKSSVIIMDSHINKSSFNILNNFYNLQFIFLPFIPHFQIFCLNKLASQTFKKKFRDQFFSIDYKVRQLFDKFYFRQYIITIQELKKSIQHHQQIQNLSKKQMYSDIRSVRSNPLSPRNSRGYLIRKPNTYFESEEGSISRFENHGQRWKSLLLPQIDQKYQQIMKQREGATKKVDLKIENSRDSLASRTSRLNQKLSTSRMMDMKTAQNTYEQKIDALEYQNQNLRQELFYLREALLINFETKDKMKEKDQNTSSQKVE